MVYKLRKRGQVGCDESNDVAVVKTSKAIGKKVPRAAKVGAKLQKAKTCGGKYTLQRNDKKSEIQQKAETRDEKCTFENDEKSSAKKLKAKIRGEKCTLEVDEKKADEQQVQIPIVRDEVNPKLGRNNGVKATCRKNILKDLPSSRIQTRRTKVLQENSEICISNFKKENTLSAVDGRNSRNSRKKQDCEAANAILPSQDEEQLSVVARRVGCDVLVDTRAAVSCIDVNTSQKRNQENIEEELLDLKASSPGKSIDKITEEVGIEIQESSPSHVTSNDVSEPVVDGEQIKFDNLGHQNLLINESKEDFNLSGVPVSNTHRENIDSFQKCIQPERSCELSPDVLDFEPENDTLLKESSASDWSVELEHNSLGPPQKKRKVDDGTSALPICVVVEEDEIVDVEKNLKEGEITSSPGLQSCEENAKIISDFAKLKVVKVLHHDGYSFKFVAVHETLPEKIFLELKQTPFDEKKIEEIISGCTNMAQIFSNDVHCMFSANAPQNLSKVQVTATYPVGNKALVSLKEDPLCVVEETASQYESVSKWYIRQRRLQRRQWLYNILDGVSEVERVILRDADPETGFVLLPDLKWTGEQLSDLYCQAVVNRRDLASIRDLTGDCLPLLRNIRDKGTRAICEKYGVHEDQLYVFLHYLPSFYHLHVHFTNLAGCNPGVRYGNIHPLVTVISNLKLDPLYYQKCTLSFVVGQNHPHPLCRTSRATRLHHFNKSGSPREPAFSVDRERSRGKKRKRSFARGMNQYSTSKTWSVSSPAGQQTNKSFHKSPNIDQSVLQSHAQGSPSFQGASHPMLSMPPGASCNANIAYECGYANFSSTGPFSVGQTPSGSYFSGISTALLSSPSVKSALKSSVWSRLTVFANDESTTPPTESVSLGTKTTHVEIESDLLSKTATHQAVAGANQDVETIDSPRPKLTPAAQECDDDLTDDPDSAPASQVSGDLKDAQPVESAPSSDRESPDSKIGQELTESMPEDSGVRTTPTKITSVPGETVDKDTVSIKGESAPVDESFNQKFKSDANQDTNELSVSDGPGKVKESRGVLVPSKVSSAVEVNPSSTTEVYPSSGNTNPGPSGTSSSRRSNWAEVPGQGNDIYLPAQSTTWIRPPAQGSTTWKRPPAHKTTWIRPPAKSTTWIRPPTRNTSWIRPPAQGTTWVRSGQDSPWYPDVRNIGNRPSPYHMGNSVSDMRLPGRTSDDFTGTDRALVSRHAPGWAGDGEASRSVLAHSDNDGQVADNTYHHGVNFGNDSPHSSGSVHGIGGNGDELVSLRELQSFLQWKKTEAMKKREAQHRAAEMEERQRYRGESGDAGPRLDISRRNRSESRDAGPRLDISRRYRSESRDAGPRLDMSRMRKKKFKNQHRRMRFD